VSSAAAGLRSRAGGARLGALSGSRAASAAFALLALYAAVHLYRKGAGTSFFYDEWNWIQDRHGGALSTFLEPHNQHLSIVPVTIYKLLFASAGLDHYGAYRLVAVLLHVTVATLLFAFVRARLGGWLALAAAAMLLFLGAGYEDVLWPFQIGYLLSLAFGLGSLLLLGRETRRGDIGAALALALALASSSIGIPMAIGIVAYLAWRPARWRRLWVAAAPIALYAVWYLGYGESALKRENVTAAPGFTADEAAAAMAGVTGLTIEWGRTLAALAAGGLVWRISRVRGLSQGFAMALVTALSFWGLTALARADFGEPGASRYLYPGGLFVLLIAAEALSGWRPSRLGLGLAGAGALLAALSGLGSFHDGANSLRNTDRVVRAELAALEIGGGRIAPGFRPDTERAPQVYAGTYLAAVRDIGSSPALGERELAGIDDGRRKLADGVLARGYALRLAPGAAPAGGQGSGPGAAPVADQPIQAAVIARGGCVTALPQTGNVATLAFTAPPGGVSIRAPGARSVSVRRFADSFGDPLAGDPRAALLRMPADRSRRPWHVLVSGARTVRACGLGATP
jgi:hypothetical protein